VFLHFEHLFLGTLDKSSFPSFFLTKKGEEEKGKRGKQGRWSVLLFNWNIGYTFTDDRAPGVSLMA